MTLWRDWEQVYVSAPDKLIADRLRGYLADSPMGPWHFHRRNSRWLCQYVPMWHFKEALHDVVKSGKARYVGASRYSHFHSSSIWNLNAACMLGNFAKRSSMPEAGDLPSLSRCKITTISSKERKNARWFLSVNQKELDWFHGVLWQEDCFLAIEKRKQRSMETQVLQSLEVNLTCHFQHAPKRTNTPKCCTKRP